MKNSKMSTYVMIVFAIAAVLIVVYTLWSVVTGPPRPCSTYKNSVISEVPVRCLDYFHIGEGGIP